MLKTKTQTSKISNSSDAGIIKKIDSITIKAENAVKESEKLLLK